MTANTVRHDDVFVPEAGIIQSDVGGELVLFHPEDMSYYGLNVTAAMIWKKLDGERTVRAICLELAQETESDFAEVEKDVLEFLGILIGKRFMSASSGNR
jgi:hypothetical protein